MNDKLTAKQGVYDALPTIFSYISVAIAFGIIARSAGLNFWFVMMISMFTYAGSSQFVMISMLATHAPILSIVLAVFLVNARMIIMSMVIAPYFKNDSLAKNIWLGTLLTDESFAVSVNKLNYTNHTLNYAWYDSVNTFSFLVWLISTITGALIGNLIPNPKAFGLDFAVVAMFMGLLYMQVISDKTLSKALQISIIFVVLGLVYFGLIIIPANLLLIIITFIACTLGVVIKHAIK
ncbi:AzlC family ABC transporter permease [Lactobacillaceae bacterium Melli_B4]